MSQTLFLKAFKNICGLLSHVWVMLVLHGFTRHIYKMVVGVYHSHKTMCLLNRVLKLTNLEQSILTWDNAMEWKCC
jgi:hypothetical protein